MLYSCPNLATIDVVRERTRQIKAEAFTPDQKTPVHDLSSAAATYIAAATGADHEALVAMWPWAPESLKSMGPREDLVRAAALLIAAIEALDAEGRKEELVLEDRSAGVAP